MEATDSEAQVNKFKEVTISLLKDMELQIKTEKIKTLEIESYFDDDSNIGTIILTYKIVK